MRGVKNRSNQGCLRFWFEELDGWLSELFIYMRKGGSLEEFRFGHVKFEKPISYPT